MRRSRRLNLAERTILITGGASGIGAATAHALVAAGANVAVIDLQQPIVDRAVERLGERAMGVAADVTDIAAVEHAVEQTVKKFGSLDVVFANAGVAASRPTTIRSTSPEEFERIVEVDLLGVWRTVRTCLPHIEANGGHILVTSSIYAFVNGMANAPYAMSKAAVESFGRSLRAELAGTSASAGVLFPGWVDTPIIAASREAEGPSKELVRLGFPAPFRTAVPAAQIATAVLHGIETRRARIIVPRRWIGVSAARGLINMGTDAIFDRRGKIHALMRQLDGPSSAPPEV